MSARSFSSTPLAFTPLLVSLLLCAAPPTCALFFAVQQGQQRCFIEEMPGQTLLVATYKNSDFKPFGDAGFSDTSIVIRVLDPTGAQVLSRVGDTEGRVAFHSTIGGEYQLCFSTNNTRWQGSTPQKFVRESVPGCGRPTLLLRALLTHSPAIPVPVFRSAST
jgi:hypothetical protein